MADTTTQHQNPTGRQKLAAYFESGQIPTGANFKELIESAVNFADDGLQRGDEGLLSLNSKTLQASDQLEVGTGPKITLTGATMQFSPDGQQAGFQLEHLVDAKSLSLSGLNVSTETQELLRINAEGKVGIGLNGSAPTEPLHVGGNLKADGQIVGGKGLQLGSAEATADANMVVYGKMGLGAEPDQALAITVGQQGVGLGEDEGQLSLYTGGKSKLTILKEDGRVGLGATPEISLAIGGAQVGLNHSDGKLSLVNGEKVGLSLATDGQVGIGNDKVIIKADGKVGIGAEPDQALSITIGRQGTGLAENEGALSFYTGAQSKLTILADGLVGLGVTPEISLAIGGAQVGLNHSDGKLSLVNGEQVGLSVATDGKVGIGNNGVIIKADGNVAIGGDTPATSTSKLFIKGDLEVEGAIINAGLDGVQNELRIGSENKGRFTVDGRMAIGTVPAEPDGIALAIGESRTGLDFKNGQLLLAYADKPGLALGVQGDISIGKNSIAIDGDGNLSVGADGETKQLNLHGALSATDVNVANEIKIGANEEGKAGLMQVYGKVGISTESPEIALAIGTAGAGLDYKNGGLILHSTETNTIRIAPYKQKESIKESPPTEEEEGEATGPKVNVIVDGDLNVKGSLNFPHSFVTEKALEQTLRRDIFKQLFYFETFVEKEGESKKAENPDYYSLLKKEDVSAISAALAEDSPILQRFLSIFIDLIEEKNKEKEEKTDFLIKKELFAKGDESPESEEEE